jgi:tripartite-type tricarboxylate transporter receptor subunit TctC
MTSTKRQTRRSVLQAGAALGVAAMAGSATSVFAQAFPSRPVTIVVPFAPGGFNDRIARAFGPFLQKQLGQPVTVVNKGGAGAQIGHMFLLQQPADGYTIAMTSVNYISTNIGLTQAPFKLEDFDVLNLPSNDYTLLATAAESKWKNVGEIIAALKKDPKSVSIGVQPGSADLINITLLLKAAGIDPSQVRIVTYKGGGPTRNAVLGSTVDVGLVGAEGWVALKPRIRALMTFADEKVENWEDVQTVEDFGKANKLNVEWVPGSQRGWTVQTKLAKDFPDRRAKLVDALKKAQEDPEWVAVAKEQKFPNPWYGPEKSQQMYMKGSAALNRHMSMLTKD